MRNCNLHVFCLLSFIWILQGCVAAAATGAVAGTAAVVDPRTTGTIIEDEAIELKARKALINNDAVNDQVHINFTSYNMYVLVTGEAPSEELRQEIIEMVRTTDKVKHVYNEITVAAPSSMVSRSSDTVLTSKVKTKLLASNDVRGNNVKVVTEKGIVYLMGLTTRKEADAAANIASQTGGVQKVVKLFEYSD